MSSFQSDLTSLKMMKIPTEKQKGTKPSVKMEKSNPNRSKLVNKTRNIRTWNPTLEDVKIKEFEV